MLYSLTFTINVLPITLNKVLSSHWRVKHKNFLLIHQLIRFEIFKKIPSRPILKARVTLTRYSCGELDPDNMQFTFKPVLDSLVKLGVIFNDTPEQIKELVPIQVKSNRKEARIEVHVQELK